MSFFFTVHRVLEAIILEKFATSSASGPHFVRTLHCDLSVSSCGKQGLLSAAVRGLLIAMASLFAEHGL